MYYVNIIISEFRDIHVRKGLIKIFLTGTDNQVADTLTMAKALPQNIFVWKNLTQQATSPHCETVLSVVI
jgi:hypothetical protein